MASCLAGRTIMSDADITASSRDVNVEIAGRNV
jgi:hypothetical protein